MAHALFFLVTLAQIIVLAAFLASAAIWLGLATNSL